MGRENDTTQKLPTEVASTTIPVIREEVVIDKLTTVTGKVEVTVNPTTEVINIPIDLERVTYREERHAVDTIVDDYPNVRQEGDTMIIPVVREEAVVVKRLRLVEEIHIIKESTTETTTESVALRRDEVAVVRQ